MNVHNKNSLAKLLHLINSRLNNLELKGSSDLDERAIKSYTSGIDFYFKEKPSPEQIHAKWANYKKSNGWKFGTKKSDLYKTHPNLVEYAKLSANEKLRDYIFIAVCECFKEFIEDDSTDSVNC